MLKKNLLSFSNLALASVISISLIPLNARAVSDNNPYLVADGGQIMSYMTLTSTGKTNNLGNPLYSLNLYANGQLIATYDTVTGRVNTQKRNRHKSGTEAPLPDGQYKVAKNAVSGAIPEAGQLFLPIYPKFKTGRSGLGIHYDPSFGKKNGEDGTSGCIGLTHETNLYQVLNYVRTYQPTFLKVNIL